MEDRIAKFADIDTRRAIGLKPRRLPPSNLVLHKPNFIEPPYLCIQVVLSETVRIIADERGEIDWRFGTPLKFRSYAYCRNGKPTSIIDVEGDTIYTLKWKHASL